MDYIFILSSVTYALKGKKALESSGIKVSLVKSANLKELRGCGYGLKVPLEDKKIAENILVSHGVRIISHQGDKE
jgi:hypothetical protein